MKNKYLSISVVCGIIAMLWVLVCNLMGWPSWAGFIGWSVYFYGGAQPEAIKTSGPGFVLGALLAMLTVWVMGLLPDQALVIVIPVFFLAFLMTYAQNSKWFQVAPATFLGSALYFATGSVFDTLVVGFFLGLIVLGLLSTYLNQCLSRYI